MLNIQAMGTKANIQFDGNFETILKELAGVAKVIITVTAKQIGATEEEVRVAFVGLCSEVEVIQTSGADDQDDGSVGMTD